jgi:hypothetical protein
VFVKEKPPSKPLPKFKKNLPLPSNKGLTELLKSLDGPVLADLMMVRKIIKDTGIDKSLYANLLKELEDVQTYIGHLDAIISLPAPQDWGEANDMYDALDGSRGRIATLMAYYEAEYEGSKKSFWPDKDAGTERYRERYQDAGSAPFVYLLRRYDERLKSMDKKMVRLNKILERENTLLNRGGV